MILCDEILRYRAGRISRPFFYAPKDESYRAVFDELTRDSNADVVKVSNFCMSNDRFPDIDALTDVLEDSPQKLKIVAGLGGYLALKGADFAVKVLRRMKDINSRCVFLLRFVGEYARKVAEFDWHMKEQGRYFVAPDSCGNISVVVSGHEGRKGIKALISRLEEGDSGEILTDTALNLDGSLLEVVMRIPEHDAGLLGRIGARVRRFFGGGDTSQTQAITHGDNQQPQDMTHADNQQPQDTTHSDNQQPQDMTHADNQQSQDMTHADNQQPQATTYADNPQSQAITNVDNQQPQATTNADNQQPQTTTHADNPQPQATPHNDDSQPTTDSPPEIHSKPAEIRSDFDAIFNG